MKFGKQLKDEMDPEWETYYLNYSLLKAILKRVETAGNVEGFSNSLTVIPSSTGDNSTDIFNKDSLGRITDRPVDEKDFYRTLEREIAKINDFVVVKGTEIRNRLEMLSQRLEETEMTPATREKARNDADEIALDFLRFEKFVNMNFNGVDKILKKHDKAVPESPCKGFYLMKLRDMEWVSGKYDDVPVALSELHTKIRADKSSMKDKQEEGGKQAFVRKTTKYWVRINDISKIKLLVLRHLPVFQFTQNKGDSQLINSVYLDNARLELCHGRLDKSPQAQAIRFRWYDTPLPTSTVFVERKTHRDSWTGEESVKERFPLKQTDIIPLLNGKIDLEKKIEKMRAAGKSESEISEFRRLSTEVLAAVTSKKLMPCVRTQYTRTAFQIPFDATVRISIDTNLCMIKETDNEPGRWFKDPSKSLSAQELSHFPFAVVEVKLQTSVGADAPAWVQQELLDSGMFKEVHKFSKFIHGCAQMLREYMTALPYWLNDVQLREYYESKATTGPKQIMKKSASNLRLTDLNSKDRVQPYVEEQQRRDTAAVQQRRDTAAGQRKRGASGNSDGGLRASLLGDEETHYAVPQARKDSYRGGRLSVIGIAGDEHQFDSSLVESKTFCWCIPLPEPKKALKIPMKIEPKVFFANERTFLSWIHMATTLSGIAAVLMAAVNKGPAQGAGLVMTFISAMFILYAMLMFQIRASKLRVKEDGYFDEKVGPTAAVVVLLISMVVVCLMATHVIPTSSLVTKIK